MQLPEGLSVFGQALETRFARSISLLTGALPAQYGFFTAGVLDIQTKTGLTNPGLALTMYGGSFNWLQPSFEYGGHEGPVDWFFTGDHLSNERGIKIRLRPTMQFSLTRTQQNLKFQITRTNSLSWPQRPGITSFNSKGLNEVQHELNQFGVLSLQKHIDNIDMQISAFVRNGVLSFSPDVIGDLLFNGVTPFARKSDLAEGVQANASWQINDSHTLRGGFLGQVETTIFDTATSVLPVDSTGAQTSIVPVNIVDNGARTGGLYGVYLQDEWRIFPTLTLNSGLRFDGVNEFTNETQLSPAREFSHESNRRDVCPYPSRTSRKVQIPASYLAAPCKCVFRSVNRTKMFHAKQIGTIAQKHAPRENAYAEDHNGILPCFFQGFSRFLLRSMASARATRFRVSRGMMISSI